MAKREKQTAALWAVTAALGLGALVCCAGQARRRAPVRLLAPDTAALAADFVPLDVNEAAAEELEALPGIGPVLAERILAWREENGPFPGPEALEAVPGVGPAVLAAIEDYIIFG